eukprot:15240-Heterococcus_DN1.PRE.1
MCSLNYAQQALQHSFDDQLLLSAVLTRVNSTVTTHVPEAAQVVAYGLIEAHASEVHLVCVLVQHLQCVV